MASTAGAAPAAADRPRVAARVPPPFASRSFSSFFASSASFFASSASLSFSAAAMASISALDRFRWPVPVPLPAPFLWLRPLTWAGKG